MRFMFGLMLGFMLRFLFATAAALLFVAAAVALFLILAFVLVRIFMWAFMGWALVRRAILWRRGGMLARWLIWEGIRSEWLCCIKIIYQNSRGTFISYDGMLSMSIMEKERITFIRRRRLVRRLMWRRMFLVSFLFLVFVFWAVEEKYRGEWMINEWMKEWTLRKHFKEMSFRINKMRLI